MTVRRQRSVKISGTLLGDIVPKVEADLDAALAGTLGKTQAALSESNPKDSGRMASSWFIGYNTPERGARPESWAPKGAKRVELSIYPPNSITFKDEWYISNNLPYSVPVCLLGGYPRSWGGSAPTSIPEDWFTAIVNQIPTTFQNEYKDAEQSRRFF